MTEHTLKVTRDGKTEYITGTSRESFLSALRSEGYPVTAPCGGIGKCGQCKIQVSGTVRSLTLDGESRIVSGGELLACLFAPDGDCEIVLPGILGMRVETGGVNNIAPCGTGLGVAVDIGTTTVAAFLYERDTGKRLAEFSARNAQRAYGADVISRISYSSLPGGREILTTVIRNQLSGAIDSLCAGANRSRREVAYVAIAGNTVMGHLFSGLSPAGIGVSPFKPESLFGVPEKADMYFAGLSDVAMLYLCPAVAGYVGGDITAGLYASGAAESAETVFYIDIGTNGEMALGSKGGWLTCATAAGPAFEGAETERGMDASPGAIDRVRLSGGKIWYHTIGNAEAIGLCGSGLIDAVAALLELGAITESGRLLPPSEAPEDISGLLTLDESNLPRFHFTEKAYITAKDVRAIQQAKAAIRAGIETLLAKRKDTVSGIQSVIIAGGFGAYMDAASACAIGLLPPAFLGKTRHVGNSAGYGAALSLALADREGIHALTEMCGYLELSSDPIFRDKYVESLICDESRLVTREPFTPDSSWSIASTRSSLQS